jgi:hypothetical protein
MSKKKSEKPEEAVLFPEVKIAGIKIKPWSFGKLFDISLYLDNIIEKAESKGVIKKLEEDAIDPVLLARLFSLAGPEVLEIIAVTTEKDIDTIKSLSMEDGISIAHTIFLQNKEKIKNALTPLFLKVKEEGEA